MKVSLPFGNKKIEIDINEQAYDVDVFLPGPAATVEEYDPTTKIEKALSSPLGGSGLFSQINENTTISIAINDKTRPVPNPLLLTPLINKLISVGASRQNISLFIASGTHLPMRADEFELILNHEIIKNYSIYSHNCDENDKLCAIGCTSRGTPVIVNHRYFESDLKIVVGDIELHHFAGYSGGVKSAAIGLTSRVTINTNHRLLLDERSTIGNYQNNPLRQDIEEIGRMIGINFALNAVVNENKEIVDVFFGDPIKVMNEGIKCVNKICQVPVDGLYDLVIASPGGYPKDINLYQSQKAMTHAAKFCRQNGTIVIIAECREGVGSNGYLEYMMNISDPSQVIEKFSVDGFSVGPHKAYQVARILEKYNVFLLSTLDKNLVSSLLLAPLEEAADLADILKAQGHKINRIAILPYATACIPKNLGDRNG